jgi:murein DD-endopeptidase MepM/ murein hydrolase activator NlpD
VDDNLYEDEDLNEGSRQDYLEDKRYRQPSNVPPALKKLADGGFFNKNRPSKSNKEEKPETKKEGNESGEEKTKEQSDDKKKPAIDLKSIAKNQLDQHNPVLKIKAELMKWKIIAYIVGGAFALFMFIFTMIILVQVIMAPIQAAMNALSDAGNATASFFEKSWNWVSFKGYNSDQKTFYNALIKVTEDAEKKGVYLDTPLIVSALFYNQAFDPDSTYFCDPEDSDCDDETATNFSQLEKHVWDLADNMIKEAGTKYYCEQANEEPEDIDDGTIRPLPNDPGIGINYFNKFNYLGSEDTTIRLCGYSKEACLCEGGTITSEKFYTILTKEEYAVYLKNSYLPIRMKQLDITIPTGTEERNNFLNNAVDEIFQKRDSYIQLAGYAGTTEGDWGISVSHAGQAGPMSLELMNALSNPLGDQYCLVNYCYRCYFKENCGCGHWAVDLRRNLSGAQTQIYSIADGEITSLTLYSKNCTSETCSKSERSGTSITIKHTLDIGGENTIIYSQYYHLNSIANDNWPLMLQRKEPIYVRKGELIGIMGNTGVSSGEHLDFRIYNQQMYTYNPEELMAYHKCDFARDCNEVRNYCDALNSSKR